jgi:hypothetical protein
MPVKRRPSWSTAWPASKARRYAGLALLLVVLGAGLAEARREPLTLIAWTVDSGGGGSSAGRYRMDGTIGQADAAILSGGTFQLQAGFWNEQPSGPISSVYLPLLQR